jgi:multicomponent K+:H+ antiporter subunit F
VILATALPWLAGAFTLAILLTTWRLIKGPGLPDRILALDTLYVNACALLVLVGIYFGTTLFFEAALVIALLGFIGTVVLSKFMVRGDIVE